MARPAASASSIALAEVMPLLPSAAGQSLWFTINTGAHFPPDRSRVHAAIVDHMVVVRSRHEYGHCGRTDFPECRQ